jgi:hypothetical protein
LNVQPKNRATLLNWVLDARVDQVVAGHVAGVDELHVGELEPDRRDAADRGVGGAGVVESRGAAAAGGDAAEPDEAQPPAVGVERRGVAELAVDDDRAAGGRQRVDRGLDRDGAIGALVRGAAVRDDALEERRARGAGRAEIALRAPRACGAAGFAGPGRQGGHQSASM